MGGCYLYGKETALRQEVWVIDAVRTPIGRYGGALSRVRPDDLAALTLAALMQRQPSVPADAIEDVVLGCANQAGEDNRNVARMAALLAGLPVSVGGTTINRLCASGLDAIIYAARALACGDGELIIAGGVESMSRAPWVLAKSEEPFSRQPEIHDTTLGWRFINPRLARQYPPYSMGETAENVAERFQISREQQDLFALGSQQKYHAAEQQGWFSNERIPVQVNEQPQSWCTTDEHPRQVTLEKLAALPPVFRSGGTVTAGNSSGINDGAAALLLATATAAQRYGLQPLARIVATAVAGVDPAYMGIGPVPATYKALQRAGLKGSEIGLVELNEAFAAQCLACMQELDLDPALVNVQGGAIALGHPLGCSGARISCTLLHAMHRKKIRYGLATLCVGVGQGVAVIYEGLKAD
ncbi:MAG: acetyl-CoA C-acyltransferase [Chitinophagales bacterium]|nr:acetyl-CoA C-acyltransferase [Chitinophagales bacterium]MDW8393199.1 acetyl-CoA C-acyltransferase [Chitinophagales bacterium]